MNNEELNLLIENFPDKHVLRRYKTYIENKGKSFPEIHNKYIREVRNANKNGVMHTNIKELQVITDAFRKSIRGIEKKGIESIFDREDIVELAMSINPICVNDKVNNGKTKEYIKKFRLRLETGKEANYKYIFSDRFGEEETFRKDLLKYIKNYKKRIIDISTLKNKRDIHIFNVYTKDNYHLHIKCYKYNGHGIKIVFEDMYESKYLQSYITMVEKGIIDYKVMKRRSIISKQCRKKIKKGLDDVGYKNENYLLVSQFSTGIINSFIYNNDGSVSFQLVEGNLKILEKHEEKK